MYDPNETADLVEESVLMSKGRLIKARFLSQDPPNVSWYWIGLGNCLSCKFFTTERCLNPKISTDEFIKYQLLTSCPEFVVGMEKQRAINNDECLLDVMKAAGLVSGTPSQKVHVIRNEPWTMHLARQAHQEQSHFLRLAMAADKGGSNDPNRGEYVDMSDDLERPTPSVP